MRRAAIFTTIFLLTVVGVPLGIIWPSIKQIRETSHDIYFEYQFLEERNKRGQNIRLAKKEYDELKIHLPKIKSLAIEPSGKLAFITVLESLAEDSGVIEKVNLDVDNQSAFDSYSMIPIKLTVRGPYRNIVKYIAALRAAPAVISFDELKLINKQTSEALKISGADNKTSMEASLSGVIYERK